MKRVALTFFLFCGSLSLVLAQTKSPNVLPPTDFDAAAQREKGVLLDVRTPAEYRSGHIAGATLMDFTQPDFAGKLKKLDRQKPYFVYCKVGGRSSKAQAMMQEMGFTRVYNLSGGFDAWKSQGLPVKK